MQQSKPEEGCAQEVRAAVCSQPEDVQQGVHIQFDSRPEEIQFKYMKQRNRETESQRFKCEKWIEKHQTSAWRPACNQTVYELLDLIRNGDKFA
jgi:hypothetical protein